MNQAKMRLHFKMYGSQKRLCWVIYDGKGNQLTYTPWHNFFAAWKMVDALRNFDR